MYMCDVSICDKTNNYIFVLYLILLQYHFMHSFGTYTLISLIETFFNTNNAFITNLTK